MNRRSFLKVSAAGTAAAYLATRAHFLRRAYGATQVNAIPLPGSALPQFADELPILGTGMVLATGNALTIRMKEFQADMMPTGFMPIDPATGLPPVDPQGNLIPYSGTYVWGYQTDGNPAPTAPNGAYVTYINPVVLATRHVPTQITWVNDLPTGANSQTYWQDWTDQTLHWARGISSDAHYTGQVPAVAHLHGGEVPPQLDGGPDAWFTPDGIHGHAYWDGPDGTGGNTSVYNYPNTQEAAPIWFHDHALGITRINVYAGIAGAYLLLDPAHPWPIDPTRIVPIVIQDRMFDTMGQLYFPNVGINPEHPFWVPEFEGDVICVNGKVWPRLTVGNKRYVFWFLNGSNARTYEFSLVDPLSDLPGPAMWVIGTDGGLLDTPVPIDPALAKLVMMPGERYLVMIDFAGFGPGDLAPDNVTTYSGEWLMRNTAKTPFPAGVAPGGTTTGRIMKFVVDKASTLPDETYNPAGGGALRDPMIRLAGAQNPPQAPAPIALTRQLTLNEVMGAGGPLAALVNNSMWDGKRPSGNVINGGVPGPDGMTYYTELPVEGTTELWEIVNLTADAHPIHLHLVQFQLLDRQMFNVNKYSGAYAAAFVNTTNEIDPMTGLPYPNGVYIPEFGPPLAYDSGGKLGGNPDVGALRKNKALYLQGPAMPPLPEEAGWKDTVIMYPGQVTRILVRWAPTDLATDTLAADLHFPFDPNGGHGYVWHCHIIDHEDNEMMRPDAVTSVKVTNGKVVSATFDSTLQTWEITTDAVLTQVSADMTVKNVTDGSMGRITNVTTPSTVTTTVLTGGTLNVWAVDDLIEIGPPRDFIKGLDY